MTGTLSQGKECVTEAEEHNFFPCPVALAHWTKNSETTSKSTCLWARKLSWGGNGTFWKALLYLLEWYLVSKHLVQQVPTGRVIPSCTFVMPMYLRESSANTVWQQQHSDWGVLVIPPQPWFLPHCLSVSPVCNQTALLWLLRPHHVAAWHSKRRASHFCCFWAYIWKATCLLLKRFSILSKRLLQWSQKPVNIPRQQPSDSSQVPYLKPS